ncbi:hypothetical protein HJFPF1_10774 [Paramyrothecium foliicola]|nr:hypothetical protein HJFPF1_10774 [Paramyrothecium foliicola]
MAPSINTSILAAVLLAGGTAFASANYSLQDHRLEKCNGSASALIGSAIQALGGREALSSLKSVTFELFRVRTVSQNYNLFETDRFMVSAGSQNVSFSFHEETFSQRIDRTYLSSGTSLSPTIPIDGPEMSPRDMSLVLRSGADGFACQVKGSNAVTLPADRTVGYLDSAITEYLLLQALKLSPKLLIDIESHSPVPTSVTFREAVHPAIHDRVTNITVVFDPESHLPLLIRTFENHRILGPATRDLQLFNYKEIHGILFPHSQKTIYQEHAIIEETDISKVHVDSAFEEGFFSGLSSEETETTPSPPKAIPGYEHAYIGDWWSNTLWTGPYRGTLGNAVAKQLYADLPGVYHLSFSDNPNFSHLILEFEDSVMVFEAPPQQTDLVIQWVEENLRKPISHLWVSHHHHDHNLDVAKFVKIGASIIVPEIAASYWSQIPDIDLVTFTVEKPYIHSDGKLQARFLWQPEASHSSDWTYAMVTSACPDANSTMLAFTADSFNPTIALDSAVANGWLLQAIDDGLSRNAT